MKNQFGNTGSNSTVLIKYAIGGLASKLKNDKGQFECGQTLDSSRPFDNLTENNTHIVAIVLFRFGANNFGNPFPNNYIVTAYQKEVG